MDARQKAIGIITGSRVDALEAAGLVVVEKGENERLREALKQIDEMKRSPYLDETEDAIRQFERWRDSGWSKSEVPNSACLALAIDALREIESLRAENERLRELLEKECERCACCLLRQRDSLRVRCEKLEGVVKNLLHEIDEGIPCRENGDGIYIGNAIDPECDAVKEAKDALAEGGSGE